MPIKHGAGRGTVRRLLLAAGIVTLGTGTIGCVDFSNDCSVNMNLPCFNSGTGGSGGSTMSADCIPTIGSAAVGDACGVFVSSSLGDDTQGDGTKVRPFATIAKALHYGSGAPVYLCGETFDEQVTIAKDTHVFGALDCVAGWVYTNERRTTIAPSTEGFALQVTSKAAVQIEDVDITAADATSAGGSSIAVLAESETTVVLTRSEVTAGNGAEGESPVPEGTGKPGPMGDNGLAGCFVNQTLAGGKGGHNVCVDGTLNVSGGGGGNATIIDGGDGSAGKSGGMPGGSAGLGAVATPPSACTNGGDGPAGTDGDPGDGASDIQLGTLDVKGFTGASGSDGKSAGAPGGGAGGGGGSRWCVNTGFVGPSGGGGGAGGCGGAIGKGGKGGGASIGVASLGATLSFVTVTIKTGNGGKGGAGGAGQPGGKGGDGGMPGPANDGSVACAGGKGGDGGTGGRGGGGLGGPSIGIAHTGIAPNVEGATITPGMPGDGGEGDGATGKGASGVAAPVQAF